MHATLIRVLSDLKRAKSKGITFDDYRVGFRLPARIFELRKIGYQVDTIKELLPNDVLRARYVLIKSPSTV